MPRPPAPARRPSIWRWLIGRRPGPRPGSPAGPVPRPAPPGSTWAAAAGPRSEPRPSAAPAAPAVVGLLLVLVVLAVGAFFAARPGPVALDRWAQAALLPRRLGTATRITSLGSPVVLAAGAILCALVGSRHRLSRGLACGAGPLLAAASSQLLLKPAVGRRLFDVPTFPSGTVVVVAAVSCAAALAVRGWGRPVVATAGLAATGLTGAAVVALRWHYGTDALAGAAWGIGVVLLVDGLAGAAGRHLRPRRAPAR